MSSPNDWNTKVIQEFRANKGQVGGNFAGSTLLLLHTTGAKTGQERVNPVACLRDGDNLVVIASKNGAPVNPDWYHNLLAHPEVTVEVGVEQIKAHATVAAEPERTRLYDAMAKKNPGFAEYPKMTTRQIPVVILHPIK